MTRAESPTLRQKLDSLRLQGVNSPDWQQLAVDKAAKAIDLAVWKVILNHIQVPGLKPLRQMQTAQHMTERGLIRGQSHTLELYDSGLSMSADESSSHSQSCDSPQRPLGFGDRHTVDLTDTEDGPTLEIWPDESAQLANISSEPNTDWFWTDGGLFEGSEMDYDSIRIG
jgi:hypothetical protein